MSRGAYPKVSRRNAPEVRRIRAIKADHPFWGYRRVWAHLKYIDGFEINQKRVHLLMKEHKLLVMPNLKLRAICRANTSKPRPFRCNQWWGIDMTKVMIDGFGWVCNDIQI